LTSGDFDSDSYFELVIGTPDKNTPPISIGPDLPSAGEVYILSGSPLGLETPAQRGPYFGVTDFGRFGASLAVGDFNGDSHPDVAIGAPLDSLNFAATSGAGFVLVVYGTSSGIPNNVVPAPPIVSQQWDQAALGVECSWGWYWRLPRHV